MSDPISTSPAKVQFIEADEASSDVNGIIEGATVEVDAGACTVRISGEGRDEKASIEGELIASARGLKILCGQDGDVRKSLHLAFNERSELDDLLARLQEAGLSVVRALDEDPDLRVTQEEARSDDHDPPRNGDTNEVADEKATILDPSGDAIEGKSSK